ncbi:MAG TPA: asparagine synthase (glutamine-hydrolyzing), partial [Pyrinomonadaceae bacterium]
MCGITGWVHLTPDRPSDLPTDELVLRSMCDRIRHRGPDSDGMFHAAGVGLGIRRLAVIDLVTGEQPFYDESRSTVAVLNGEIYNFRELRDDLTKRGHKFISSADTEVLPHLYEEYGLELVDKLNGMFAFAIWDAKRRRLFIARDPLGEKPLYYGKFNDKLIFGSEIKALLAHRDVAVAVNNEALKQYLTFDCIPAPMSIFEGICKLPAGHFLTVEQGTVSVKRYWDLDHRKRKPVPSIDEAAEELDKLLHDSTRLRMASDVPIGVFLSGGVDSSVIAAYATRHAHGRLKTFCVGFDDSEYNESSPAAVVADHLGTEHHEARLSASAAAGLVPEIANWLDEPLADPSIVPTFYLSRFTRSMVTVALGGDGSDELFGGYPSYYAHKLIERYATLPQFIKKRIVQSLIRMVPHNDNEAGLGFIGRRFLRAVEIQ